VPGLTGEGRRAAGVPGQGLLQLRGDADQEVVPARGGDELHVDREPFTAAPSGRLIAGLPEMPNTAVKGPYAKRRRSQERTVYRGPS
jgi:hypothetical protein